MTIAKLLAELTTLSPAQIAQVSKFPLELPVIIDGREGWEFLTALKARSMVEQEGKPSINLSDKDQLFTAHSPTAQPCIYLTREEG